MSVTVPALMRPVSNFGSKVGYYPVRDLVLLDTTDIGPSAHGLGQPEKNHPVALFRREVCDRVPILGFFAAKLIDLTIFRHQAAAL